MKYGNAVSSQSPVSAQRHPGETYLPRPEQAQVQVDGKWEWGRLSDRTIPIPSRNDGTGLPGLDDEAMERWWREWLSLGPWYVWYSTSRNCAGVAKQALLAGGAENFAGPLAADYLGALTPNAVDKAVDHQTFWQYTATC